MAMAMAQALRMLSRRLGWLVWDLSPVVSAPGEPEYRLAVRVRIRRWHPGYWLYCAGLLVHAWQRAV